MHSIKKLQLSLCFTSYSSLYCWTNFSPPSVLSPSFPKTKWKTLKKMCADCVLITYFTCSLVHLKIMINWIILIRTLLKVIIVIWCCNNEAFNKNRLCSDSSFCCCCVLNTPTSELILVGVFVWDDDFYPSM